MQKEPVTTPGIRRPTARGTPAGRARRGPGAGGPQTDRLRYLDAATRQIGRGMNLDDTLDELCRAAVPAFADVACVHLYSPLPVDDETGADPGVLRLHCADHTPLHGPVALRPAEVVRPAVAGPLARLLRAGRPAFGNTPGVAA
ncbi:serine/threonine protein phosphatase, partial [Streptomyces sp. NPDC047072]